MTTRIFFARRSFQQVTHTVWGANEAPPAIISTFLGTEVSAMLDQIEEMVGEKKMTRTKRQI